MATTDEKIAHGREILQRVRDAGALDFFAYLLNRWADEREYEDWKEYDKAIREKFSFLKIIKTHKRPIGFDCETEMGIMTLQLKTGAKTGWLIKFKK